MNDEKNDTNDIESSKDTIGKQEGNYSAYEFLKNDTSLLIAVITALVAIVTVILKFASYMYHIAYLNYWNINPKIVSSTETYWLEDIASSFVLLIFGFIYFGLMNETFTTLKKHNYYVKICQGIVKNNEPRFKKSKEKKNKANNYSNIRLNLKEYTELNKWCKRTKISAWLQVFAYFVLYQLMFGIAMYLAYLKQGNMNNDSLIFLFMLTIICGLFFAIACYCLAGINKEKIEKECNDELNKTDDEELELPMFPIRKISKLGIKHFLSNKYIFRGLLFMIILFVSFIIIEHEQGKQDAENLKERISIIQIENINYAVVAQDADVFIVEKIEVQGENAVIYVNEQIIIPKESTEVKICSFDNISKETS